jgi:glycine cleavage system H protein
VLVPAFDIPGDLRYSREDEWARREEGRVTVGVSDYAQQQLGDIVFVELPQVGARVESDVAFGVIESVKAVSDLLAPVSGEVVAVNSDLEDHPESVNVDCYGNGWMIAIAIENPAEFDELLDAEAYLKHIEEREE